MIISVVAAKMWYLKYVRFLLGHPVDYTNFRPPLGVHIKDKIISIYQGVLLPNPLTPLWAVGQSPCTPIISSRWSLPRSPCGLPY